MRRREFITLLGGAAAWPLAARAQQPAMPVIGFLSVRSVDTSASQIDPFHRGLNETGFAADRDVAIEYRFADGHNDQFPALAAELVRRRVSVLVAAGGNPSALAAKAATTTIPIVFQMGADPIAAGLFASPSQARGNLAGVVSLNVEVGPRRLELLHEVVPAATVIGLLVNPTNSTADTLSRDAQAAARALGLQLQVLHASAEGELDAAFATFVQLRAGGVVIGNDGFFSSHGKQLAALSIRHALPAISTRGEYVEVGGLMSYGASVTDVFRMLGVYTGRILKGENPADLPVYESKKVELGINLKTAKALGLTVPPTLLLAADEVIE